MIFVVIFVVVVLVVLLVVVVIIVIVFVMVIFVVVILVVIFFVVVVFVVALIDNFRDMVFNQKFAFLTVLRFCFPTTTHITTTKIRTL